MPTISVYPMTGAGRATATSGNEEEGDLETDDFERNDTQRSRILHRHFVLTELSKMRMLEEWFVFRVSEEVATRKLWQCVNRRSGVDGKILMAFAGNVEPPNSFESCCKFAIAAIPDDKWMRFVRLDLKLSDDIIDKIKQEGRLTEEQEYQLAHHASFNLI